MSRFDRNALICLAVLTAAALAVMVCGRAEAGEYTTHRLTAGGLVVTNDQQNASWSLASVLIHYQKVATQDVSIVRSSGGGEYVLGVVPAGSTNVVWSAVQPVPFKFGDYFSLGSGGGTGTVQVVREPDAR